MPNNIFLDFDGTLLDVRQRLYELFQELMPASTFSSDEYWQIKRQRMNQQELLTRYFNATQEEIDTFKKAWMTKVEDFHRLETDRPLPGATEWLQKYATTHDLYLVTARQNPERVEHQLTSLKWLPYFKGIMVTRQAGSKADIILQNLPEPKPGVLIGDTGEDIRTAQSLGLTAIGVSSGFLGADVLATYNPDHLFPSINEIPDHVLQAL